MSSAQKIIKYLAIAFALFLTFSIISGIGYAFISIGNLFDSNKKSVTEKLEMIEIKEEDTISSLEIDVGGTNIIVKSGEVFQVQTDSKYIQVKQDHHKLSIQEKENSWFSNGETADLIVSVPTEFIFREVSIEVGAGRLEIEELATNNLDLELGAGKVTIDKLNVFDQADIDSGAGEVEIRDGELSNLDLNMGVGKFTLNTKLSGNSTIDHGVGAFHLNLIGSKNDYQIHFNKGLGSVSLDGDEVVDNQTIGTGSNRLEIDGGVGKIDIHFISNR